MLRYTGGKKIAGRNHLEAIIQGRLDSLSQGKKQWSGTQRFSGMKERERLMDGWRETRTLLACWKVLEITPPWVKSSWRLGLNRPLDRQSQMPLVAVTTCKSNANEWNLGRRRAGCQGDVVMTTPSDARRKKHKWRGGLVGWAERNQGNIKGKERRRD